MKKFRLVQKTKIILVNKINFLKKINYYQIQEKRFHLWCDDIIINKEKININFNATSIKYAKNTFNEFLDFYKRNEKNKKYIKTIDEVEV